MTGEHSGALPIGEGPNFAEQARSLPYPVMVKAFEEYDIYDPQGPATVYLRGLMANLCGDNPDIPDVFIVKEEGINAFNIGNAIAVHDGVFDTLEHEEELYALLSHEYTHYDRKHACQDKQNGLSIDRAGEGRAHELEADVLAMKTMDDRGINILGMVKLASKAVEQSKDRKNHSNFKFGSLVHGHDLERKVNIEQVLSIIDAKNLSTNLTPITKPELGQMVATNSEVFWQLPPYLQQANFNRSPLKKERSERNIHIQQQILEAVSSEKEDASTLRRKAELLLYPPSGQEGLSSDASLSQDLRLLQEDNISYLLRGTEWFQLIRDRVSTCVVEALYDKTVDAAQLSKIGAVVQEDLSPTPQARKAIEKTIADTLIEDGKLASPDSIGGQWKVIDKLTEYSKFMPVATELGARKCKAETIVAQAKVKSETYHAECLRSKPTLIEKLQYFVALDSDQAGKDDGWVSRSTREAIDSEIKNDILKADAPTLSKQIIDLYRAKNPYATGMAEKVMASFRTDNNKWRVVDGQVVFEIDEKLAKNYTVLLVLTMGMGGPLSRTTGALENIGEAWHSPREAIRTILPRLSRIQDAVRGLNEQYPDTFSIDIDEYIRKDKPLKRIMLHDALNACANKKDGGQKLIALMQHYGVVRLTQEGIHESSKDLSAAQKLWQKSLNSILECPGWETDEDSLLAFTALGQATSDVELNLTMPRFAISRLTRLRDFEGGIRLLQELPHAQALQTTILDILIEEKARTPEDFELLSEMVESLYINALADNKGILGYASIADSIAIPFYDAQKRTLQTVGHKVSIVNGLQGSRLLSALLSSGQDEAALKLYAAEHWWLKQRKDYSKSADYTDIFTAEDYLHYRHPGKEARLNYWLNHAYPKDAYAPFDENLGNMYLSVDAARFFAIRKLLLTEPNGVLMKQAESAVLVDALMQSWLATEKDTEDGQVLRDLLLDLVTKNDAPTSYLHIGPMLQDMILRPPQKPSDLEEATRVIAADLVNALVETRRLRQAEPRDYANIHTRIHRLFTANGQAARSKTDNEAAFKQQLLTLMDATDTQSAPQKLSTIAFAALAGKKSGALGVKMLQLAGQYFDLTPEDLQEFEGIYDDMKGQTRLQAYNTLKREATDHPALAGLFNNIRELGPRIGGGSLFTVYKVHMKDGTQTAVGIKNPNAEYRIARLAEFASTGLESTIQKHPANTTMQLMSSLLDDACQWVKDELDDPHFATKDAVFKQENNTKTGNGFQKGNARYDLTAPVAHRTDSQWVRSEAFVEGTNLTGLKISTAPTDIPAGVIHEEDFKQVASVLTRNYVYQVMKGSYAHSDIHAGNFRITEDNSQIVIFDRHNLIPMHDALRQTLRSAFGAIMMGDLKSAALTIALHAAPDNTDADALKATVDSIADASEDPSQLVTNMILTLKREGIPVPLDLSLLLRNFMSVSLLSKQAGFANIAESFMHTSTGIDELMRLGQ